MVKTAPERNDQNIYFDFIPGNIGNYTLSSHSLTGPTGYTCPQDSVFMSTNFADDDFVVDAYHLISSPLNYLKVTKYDRSKGIIEGEFAAKFVRTNVQQKSTEAVDTLTYTEGRFSFEGMNLPKN